MLCEFIPNKVYYKIFDKSFKDSSHIYAKYKYTDAEKLSEVTANIGSVKNFLSAKDLLILKQVHGIEVADADYMEDLIEVEADASITTKTGIALAIQTADCVPVLLSSIEGKIIGIAHCGWKSAKGGIIDRLVTKMREKEALQIKAIIGPAIAQSSYEVNEDYYQNFVTDDAEYKRFFIPSKNLGHHMFDLPGFVTLQLNRCGVHEVQNLFEDTYSQEDKYPSYRRSCHQEEPYKHNILSTIIIR